MHDGGARVVYEVNLDVDASIAEAFDEWLRGHVREILALDGFLGARVFEVRDPVASPGRACLCVQYELRDPQALEAYLRDHAPRMRADGLARFGGRFAATRRVLDVAAEFPR